MCLQIYEIRKTKSLNEVEQLAEQLVAVKETPYSMYRPIDLDGGGGFLTMGI